VIDGTLGRRGYKLPPFYEFGLVLLLSCRFPLQAVLCIVTAPELSRHPLRQIRSRRSAEPKNAYTGGCADIDSPIGDSWSYELIACPKVVTPRGCLITIIELPCQIAGVVSVEYSHSRILRSPDNAVGCCVR
jgi:hypothetical protein